MVTQVGRGNEDGVFPIAPQSSVGHIGHLRIGEGFTAFQNKIAKFKDAMVVSSHNWVCAYHRQACEYRHSAYELDHHCGILLESKKSENIDTPNGRPQFSCASAP